MDLTRERWCCAGDLVSKLIDMNTYQTSIKTGTSYIVDVPPSRSLVKVRDTTINSMFVRLGTDYEIRNGGYFESIKNSANQFISKP